MSIEKMRAEFELWVSQQGMSVSMDSGLHRSHVVGWMWQAWEASRSALAVELPEPMQGNLYRCGDPKQGCC